MTSELRAEPGEAWARDEGRDEAQAVHPGRHRRAPEARSSYREVFAIGNITYQASQILGFVVGAVVVAVLDPHKTLGIDAVTFGLSALILLTGVRSRPAPGRAGAARASLWSVSADGVRIVFGSRLLLTLLLFGWLAGFYIVPEGLAAPYARSLHGNALTVGLLMAAVPLGMVIGAFVISRIAAPSARIRMMGWLAVLSCAPLIGAPLAVGLAGLVGLTAATMLAMSWTHLRDRLIQAQPNGPESPIPGG